MANCEDAVFLPEVGCEDCSSIDGKITRLQNALNDAIATINDLTTRVTELETNKQDKLVAGDGIEINGNEISSVTRAMC